jgi:hypothetical protein
MLVAFYSIFHGMQIRYFSIRSAVTSKMSLTWSLLQPRGGLDAMFLRLALSIQTSEGLVNYVLRTSASSYASGFPQMQICLGTPVC